MQSVWRGSPPVHSKPLRFFLFISRPYVAIAIAVITIVTIASILSVSSSYVIKMIVTAATNLLEDGSRPLWYAAALYIGVTLSENLLWRLSAILGVHWENGARATARHSLSSYTVEHSNQYFQERFAGAISSKIKDASGSSKEIVRIIVWQFTPFIVTMISSTLLLLYTSHYLALIFIAWVLFITPLNFYFAKGRVPYSRAGQRSETILGGAIVDILSNISAVQDYARKESELEYVKKLVIERRDRGNATAYYSEKIYTINAFLEKVFIGGLLFTAIYLATQGTLSSGDIALILVLIFSIQDKLTFITSQLTQFSETWGQLSESLDDILVGQDIPDKKEAGSLSVGSSSITFEAASFRYGETSVFDNLSFTIPQGQKVGLVGRSGAGKSTLVKLLLRHYDLTGGSIKIGDQSIADVTKDSLRRAIAVVPQEPLLFHRSIRDNIAYGKPDASLEEVIKAAKLAEAHEFIEKVPGGYDALVGERGVKLSGGQRQRIVIARAILKDAPILLLDEATSALDSESEGAVQKALFTLMEHRTVIAIAHRLSTLRAMDRIIVMDEGKIIEDGTHEELLAKNGVYAMLWNHQAGGFIEE